MTYVVFMVIHVFNVLDLRLSFQLECDLYGDTILLVKFICNKSMIEEINELIETSLCSISLFKKLRCFFFRRIDGIIH